MAHGQTRGVHGLMNARANTLGTVMDQMQPDSRDELPSKSLFENAFASHCIPAIPKPEILVALSV